jgi:dihydroorotate dehydrogenase electron transfer subunit
MPEVVGTETRCAVDVPVLRCDPICRDHVAIDLAVPGFPASEPGQFVQLRCCESGPTEPIEADWPADGFPSISDRQFASSQPFLRRPFSIADRWQHSDGAAGLRIISRTVGMGTRWLAHLRPTDTVNLTGPLGRGFAIPPPDVPLVLVGGGVGIPPLLYLARRLHEAGRTDVTAIFGAASRDLLPVRLSSEPATDGTARVCVDLPGAARYPAIVTTDDGSAGLPGMVTAALRAWHSRRAGRGAPAMVCACGPQAMLWAVAQQTRQLGLRCQLCIERVMGCGIGTCLSCVVRVRDANQAAGWRWALACTDGPVFSRDELLDDGGKAPA